MGTPDQDFWQQERINERADELEMIRAIRVSEMMEQIQLGGASNAFDSKLSFSDVVEALDSDIDEPLYRFWKQGDAGEELRRLITAKAEQLCWMAARNDITHASLKEEREISRAEDRAA